MAVMRESRFEDLEDPRRSPDAEKLGSGREAKNLRLDGLVFDLGRGDGIHEVAPGDGSTGGHGLIEFPKEFERAVLPAPHVEFMKKAGGIREVEGASPERKLEGVPDDEARTKREVVRGESSFGSGESVLIRVEDGEGAVLSDPPGETFDPQRRSPAHIKHVPPSYVSEQIEFAVREGDEVFFVFVALFWREWIAPI